MSIVDVLIVLIVLGVLYLAVSSRVVKQYERGVVFRLGKVQEPTRGPGLAMIVPGIDRLKKVSMQIVTMAIPAQDGITRDNVTVKRGRGRLLPRHRSGARHCQRGELPLRRIPGRSDLSAIDHRQEPPRRSADQPGAAQSGTRADDRQPCARLGHPHRQGGDQRRRAARFDEAIHVQAG